MPQTPIQFGIKFSGDGNGGIQNTAAGALQPTDLAGAPGLRANQLNRSSAGAATAPEWMVAAARAVSGQHRRDQHLHRRQQDCNDTWSVSGGGGTPDPQGSPDGI